MQLVSRRPTPPLDQFVRTLWSCRLDAVPSYEQVLPTGTVQLLINLASDELCSYPLAAEPARSDAAAVTAASDEITRIAGASLRHIVGVEFRPGGAAPFLAAPPGSLGRGRIDLAQLWGADAARRLRAQLLTAGRPERELDCLEAALRPRLRFAGAEQRLALALAARLASGARVDRLVSETGLSHARLLRRFRAQVGLTPKHFARLTRFRAVLALREREPQLSWTELALRCGYCDQAHLIRDFRSFAAMPPSQYQPRAGTPSHLPDEEFVQAPAPSTP